MMITHSNFTARSPINSQVCLIKLLSFVTTCPIHVNFLCLNFEPNCYANLDGEDEFEVSSVPVASIYTALLPPTYRNPQHYNRLININPEPTAYFLITNTTLILTLS